MPVWDYHPPKMRGYKLIKISHTNRMLFLSGITILFIFIFLRQWINSEHIKWTNMIRIYCKIWPFLMTQFVQIPLGTFWLNTIRPFSSHICEHISSLRSVRIVHFKKGTFSFKKIRNKSEQYGLNWETWYIFVL